MVKVVMTTLSYRKSKANFSCNTSYRKNFSKKNRKKGPKVVLLDSSLLLLSEKLVLIPSQRKREIDFPKQYKGLKHQFGSILSQVGPIFRLDTEHLCLCCWSWWQLNNFSFNMQLKLTFLHLITKYVPFQLILVDGLVLLLRSLLARIWAPQKN